MKIVSLYSSSAGNSFLVTEGDSAILIDAGKNRKRLIDALCALGISTDKIGGVFITHGHCDHVSAIPVLLKKTALKFHITKPSLAFMYEYMDALPLSDRLISHDPGYEMTVGSLNIKSFPLPHDCPGTVGYIITNDKGEKYVHATDVGTPTDELKKAIEGADYLTLEANYDPDTLKKCDRPATVKKRITCGSGHISNGQCAELIEKAIDGGTKKIMLTHISAETNTTAKALECVCKALAKRNAADVFLIAADREKVTVFVR